DGGAQTGQLRLVAGAAQDLLIGLEHGLLEGGDDVGGRGVGVQTGQVPDRHRGGDVAAGVRAAPGGHHQQVAGGVAGVLVVGPREAAVGTGGIPQCEAHRGPRLSSISVRPIRTWAPGRKGTEPSMCRPEPRVPLVEPRASTRHSSSRRKLRACRLEAYSSSRTRVHSGSRAIRIGGEPRVSEVPRRGPAVTTSEVVVTAGSVRREDGSGAGPLPALGRCSRRGSLLERLTTVVP